MLICWIAIAKAIYQKIKRQAFKNYLRSTSPVSKTTDCRSIKAESTRYDAVFVGSDQVWNRSITGKDDSFLLDFGDDTMIRASYAASFGNYDPRMEGEAFFQHLNKFQGLSVREPRGIDLLCDILGNNNAELHLDPTLLHDAAYWEKYAKKKYSQKKYIFIYAMRNPVKILEAAKQLKQKTGYEILYMGKYDFSEGKKLSYVTPAEWLGLLSGAEIVLTNSFHGTAFSLIFHKRFFVDLGLKEGKIVNDRAGNLLNLFQLEDRVVDNVTRIGVEKPDWRHFDERIPVLRDKSFVYIKGVLDGNQNGMGR